MSNDLIDFMMDLERQPTPLEEGKPEKPSSGSIDLDVSSQDSFEFNVGNDEMAVDQAVEKKDNEGLGTQEFDIEAEFQRKASLEMLPSNDKVDNRTDSYSNLFGSASPIKNKQPQSLSGPTSQPLSIDLTINESWSTPQKPKLKEPAPSRKLPDWMQDQEKLATKQRELSQDRNCRKEAYKREACSQLFDEIDAISLLDDSPIVIAPPKRKYVYKDVENVDTSGRWICFDVESTGFASYDNVIEIGAVELINGKRTGALFQSYIRPKARVHPKAFAVHGLSNEKLAHAPTLDFVLGSFMSWVGTSPLVAHNARFDMRMLLQDLERQGLHDLLQDRPVFCTMRYYRKKFPRHSYALVDLAIHYKISLKNFRAHSALEDAELLGTIFSRMGTMTNTVSQSVPKKNLMSWFEKKT